MSKKAKLITIISSAVVAVALLTLVICLVVANNNREKTNISILYCNAGSEVQLVLNQNDKVTNVVPLTNDAKGITLNSNLKGLKYDEAVELFVKKNVESGYIDIDTDGYTIQITLGGDKKDYSKMQKELVKDINAYLDEMGIIAGAKVETTNSLKTLVQMLKRTAKGVDTKNNSQLMTQYLSIWSLVEDMMPNDYESFFKYYDEKDKEREDKINNATDVINDRNSEIETLNTEITNLQNEINNLPDGEEKTNKQKTLDEKIKKRSTCYSNIDTAQNDIDNAESVFTRYVIEHKNLLTENKDKNNRNLINANSNAIIANRTNLETHKTTFEKSKQDILELIKAYRESINN